MLEEDRVSITMEEIQVMVVVVHQINAIMGVVHPHQVLLTVEAGVVVH
jgi:hypothetical protein